MQLIMHIIIIIIIITATEFSLGGSNPYTSTDKTNKKKCTITKQYKDTVQITQNTVHTTTHITKTPIQSRTSYTPNEIVSIQSRSLSIRSP